MAEAGGRADFGTIEGATGQQQHAALLLDFQTLRHPWHPTYSWNIMCQKWESDCGLWVLNEIILKKYAESLKKIVGAV